MQVYLDLVILLNFLVDYLLLLGTNRLSGFPMAPGRTALAAVLGGLYGGACLFPGFRFLGNLLWRVISLCSMGIISFGFHPGTLRRCVLFTLLSMALGGIAAGMNQGGFSALVTGAAVLFVLCLLGFRGRPGEREYVEVELHMDKKKIHLVALRDTGNSLRDPVSGQSVLVVNAQTAFELLGLTKQQLLSPVETVSSGRYPGLRLIPYRSVGQANGMLTAMRLDHVRIGKWQGSTVVAFAPDGLDSEGSYQALTGGAV